MSGIPEKVMAAAVATTATSNELRTVLEGKVSREVAFCTIFEFLGLTS